MSGAYALSLCLVIQRRMRVTPLGFCLWFFKKRHLVFHLLLTLIYVNGPV